jgi:MYXO-CTERM domain-containing protein
MQNDPWGAIVWVAAVVVVAALFVRQRRRRTRVGSGGAGTVYDWLNEDKRKAVEIVVEERAGARDPEDREGILPDLENPTVAADRQPIDEQGGHHDRE